MQERKFSVSMLLLVGLLGFVIGILPTAMNSNGRMHFGGYASQKNLDRHFIEQMIPHHQDAVEMAEVAATKATHAELKKLAENIKRDQTKEIGEMREWYQKWYGVAVPEFSGSAMHGGMMQSGMGQGMMMGIMGDSSDLENLSAAKQFDKAFIEQMIPHHQMAIMMAQMMLRGTDRKELQTLAQNIVDSQSAEIEQMREWYKAWY